MFILSVVEFSLENAGLPATEERRGLLSQSGRLNAVLQVQLLFANALWDISLTESSCSNHLKVEKCFVHSFIAVTLLLCSISKLLGIIKRKEHRFTSLFSLSICSFAVIGSVCWVSVLVCILKRRLWFWCCCCNSVCHSVLDLNAFERQIKAESLGVGAEDNSGTSPTSTTKCFEKTNVSIRRGRYFLFIAIDLPVLLFAFSFSLSFSFSGDRVMADEQLTCDLFRFLQLLCEGHNTG